ncbi:MAG: PIG-L family deacetylase [bacterium]|nr:PIG-L family deacetylase [bacterium]
MALKDGVLILVAHADDTEFMAGGTVARFADEGREVVEVITTNNERGTFELTPERIIPQSEDEAREAARILGKKEVVFLGYSDGMLSDTPVNELREKFMRLIRRYRPKTLMTFDPWAPFEPHPDHRRVAFAAVEAVSFSHLPLFHPEHRDDGLEPHLVLEQYYLAKDPTHANKVVDISAFIDQKIDALCAHDCQMKLTIDDLKMALTASGAAPELADQLDRDNYRPLLELYVKAWAQEVGAKAGHEYGEEFRHEMAGGPIAELARG